MEISGNERILICPLGWGLGHSSRIIPVINILFSKGCKVFVGADNVSIAFIKSRFPNLEYLHFPSISVKFSSGKNQTLNLMGVVIRLFYRTFTEHNELKNLIKDQQIDLVISDNRYGLYSKATRSILITHQLSVRFPKPFRWLKPIGEWYVRRYAQRFTECWIPDSTVGFSVSGELTQPVRIPKNVIRIGLLSRFSGATIKSTETKWDLMAIVSGPAPHRDIFEKEIELLAQKLNLKTLILQGLPLQDGSKTVRGNVTLVANMSDEDMAEALRSAKHLICRGGYSTIMDLIALNRSAILVPTPGQTEQEYLAEYLSSNGLFVSCHQHKMKNIDHNLLNRLPNSIEGFEVDFFPLVQF